MKGKVEVCLVLLQRGADLRLCNSDGKTALDLASAMARPVLTGDYRKDDLLEAARSGNEDRLAALLTPLNVNCHASDGRRSTPLHLAAGYNRCKIVQILLRAGANVHSKDKGGLGRIERQLNLFRLLHHLIASPFSKFLCTTAAAMATLKFRNC